MKKRYYLNNKIFFVLLVSTLFSKPYKGGELRTNNTYRYGRYEVRMQSAAGDGVVSSFFTYRDYWAEGLSGSEHWNEIDWEWLGNHSAEAQTNLITQNEWSHEDLVDVDFNPHSDLHTYAFEWTPDYVAFFIDDELVRWDDNFYVDSLYHYQKIMMNIWQPTNEDWVGEFDPTILPVYAIYDWVKYYAYVPGSGNTGSDNNFILLWTDNFDYFDENRWSKATHTWDGNNSDFIHSNVVFEYGYMILCLTTLGNTGYSGDPLNTELSKVMPKSFSIGNAYPNPFNNKISLPFYIDKAGVVSFSVYNILGNQIISDTKIYGDAGQKEIFLNGLDAKGVPLPAGSYFIKVSNGEISKIQKILYLK